MLAGGKRFARRVSVTLRAVERRDSRGDEISGVVAWVVGYRAGGTASAGTFPAFPGLACFAAFGSSVFG